MYDYEERIKAYENAEKLPRYSSKKKVRDDHVFDEDKSVRWNREELVRYNQAIDDENKSLAEARYKAHEEAVQGILGYLRQEHQSISEERIKKIYYWAWEKEYDNEHRIDIVIDMADEILEIIETTE